MPEIIIASWEYIVLWLAVLVVLVVIEVVTIQLVAIWLALGALVAFIAALFGADLWLQFTFFVAVSLLALVGTRPLMKKMKQVRYTRTNADSIIGKIGVVVETIDNNRDQGRVYIDGLNWAARSEDASIIMEDEEVLIKEIQGVKVIVERA